MKKQKTLALRTLTKSQAWTIKESELFRLWKDAERDPDLRDYRQHSMEVLVAAFEIEEITVDHPKVIEKFEARGFKIGQLKGMGEDGTKWAVKKRAISRVTDLTKDNIRQITAEQLLGCIDRNFGGGWDSLTPEVQRIIEMGFEVSSTTLPADRLHNPGGLYGKLSAEGYKALEIAKGSWVEVVFVREKPCEEEEDDTALETKMHALPAVNTDDLDDDEDDFDDNTYRSSIDDDLDDEEFDDFDEDEMDEEGYKNASSSELTLDDIVASEDEF